MQSLRVARSRGQLLKHEGHVERSASKHGAESTLLYNIKGAAVRRVCVPAGNMVVAVSQRSGCFANDCSWLTPLSTVEIRKLFGPRGGVVNPSYLF